MLRRQGQDVDAATRQLKGMGVADKNELLFQSGINFNNLPAWQKRGVGLYWENYLKQSTDPRTGNSVTAERRRIKRDMELPIGIDYGGFIARFLADAPLAAPALE